MGEQVLRRRWLRLVAAVLALVALTVLTRPFPDDIVRRQDYLTFTKVSILRGKCDSAARLFTWADRDYPEAAEMQRLRFWYLVELERWDEARMFLENMPGPAGLNTEGFIALARLFLHFDDPAMARATLERLLEQKPGYEPALEMIESIDATQAGEQPSQP